MGVASPPAAKNAAGVRPPAGRCIDLLVYASLARSLVAQSSAAHVQGMRAERSSCAGKPPGRGICLHELLHRDPMLPHTARPADTRVSVSAGRPARQLFFRLST